MKSIILIAISKTNCTIILGFGCLLCHYEINPTNLRLIFYKKNSVGVNFY